MGPAPREQHRELGVALFSAGGMICSGSSLRSLPATNKVGGNSNLMAGSFDLTVTGLHPGCSKPMEKVHGAQLQPWGCDTTATTSFSASASSLSPLWDFVLGNLCEKTDIWMEWCNVVFDSHASMKGNPPASRCRFPAAEPELFAPSKDTQRATAPHTPQRNVLISPRDSVLSDGSGGVGGGACWPAPRAAATAMVALVPLPWLSPGLCQQYRLPSTEPPLGVVVVCSN